MSPEYGHCCCCCCWCVVVVVVVVGVVVVVVVVDVVVVVVYVCLLVVEYYLFYINMIAVPPQPRLCRLVYVKRWFSQKSRVSSTRIDDSQERAQLLW